MIKQIQNYLLLKTIIIESCSGSFFRWLIVPFEMVVNVQHQIRWFQGECRRIGIEWECKYRSTGRLHVTNVCSFFYRAFNELWWFVTDRNGKGNNFRSNCSGYYERFNFRTRNESYRVVFVNIVENITGRRRRRLHYWHGADRR